MKYLLSVCLCLLPLLLCAGGGPEAVVVVVNSDSDDSKDIANHYCALRRIPDLNVIYLSDIPENNTITLEQFRSLILQPILEQIQQRGLQQQIDYITYSCGFPTRVTFDRALVKKMRWVGNPQASLTGLTYLFQLSLQSEESFLNPASNLYYRKTSNDNPQQQDGERAPAEKLKAVYAFFTEKNKRAAARRKNKSKISDEDKAWETAGWAEALKTLSTVAVEYPDDTSLHYNLACAQAMNGKSEEAIAALEYCVERGYKDWQHMQRDSDLKSLRGREDFKTIIAQLKNMPITVTDSLGFRAGYGFDKHGNVVAPGKGVHYMIATMLGYTGERGNTVEEIKRYLSAAASADFTRPTGVFCFPTNGDIRSRTREWAIASCIKQLEDLGFEAEETSGKLPQNKQRVMGVVAGTPFFEWDKSGSTLLPGAIAEHLTSWGAEFDRKGQTKISAWLRAGAAGSAGTVSEPYALQFKFPTPFIHLHYARGSSLGEAFYQSVAGPYHLLILGDALCQPFASRATLHIEGLPEQAITEAVQITVSSDRESVGYLVLLNGRQISSYQAGTEMLLDPAKATPGWYDLRIVSLDAGPLQTRTAHQQLIHFGDMDTKLNCQVTSNDDTIKVSYSCEAGPAFKHIALMHNARMLAHSADSSGSLSVTREQTGAGPLRLRPVLLDADEQVIYLGKPLDIAE